MTKLVAGMSRRALVLALIALFAVSSLTAAQDAEPAPYEPPDNIDDISGSIESDGSSTVGPITNAVIEEFAGIAPEIRVVNSISGTGGGFERFCNGETDIQNASRPISADELATCAENGVAYYEFQVALDGLTVVVNPDNDFVECLTTEQLQSVFSATDQSWAVIDPAFPDETITSYAPGTDSGTYDYFSEAIMEDGDVIADEYSEDDNVLVQGVTGDEYGIGFFGFAYYEQNQDALKAVAIDGGNGCVTPSVETIQDGTYTPLSRPLYVYVRADSLERPEVQEFMRFYLASLTDLVPLVGYVALPSEGYAAQQNKLEAAIAGEGPPDSELAGTPAV